MAIKYDLHKAYNRLS